MNKSAVFVCGGFLFSLAASPAHAEPFAVNNNTVAPGTGDKVVQTFFNRAPQAGEAGEIERLLNDSLAENAATLSSRVNATLNGIGFPDFVRRSANSMALAGEQVAVDDASHFDLFSLSITSAAALSPPNFNLVETLVREGAQLLADGRSPGLGIGAATAISFGLNFKRLAVPNYRYFDFRRLTVFVHGMGFSQGIKLSDESEGTASYYSWGLAGRYRLLSPIAFAPYGLVRWEGLSVGAGFNATSIRADGGTRISSVTQTSPVSINGRDLNLDLAFSGSSELSLRLGAMSLPLEATTAIQLGYLFTFFGGAALDFNFGSSQITAKGTGPMTLTLTDPANGSQVAAGAPVSELTLDVAQSPTVVDVRGMLGLQLNLGVLALFAQGQINSASTVGFNAGLRGFW